MSEVQQSAPTRRRRELRGAVAAAFECQDREVLVEGPAGTGKSHGDLAKIHRLAWQYPRSRHLICRATRVSMTESLLKTWEEQILGDNHPAYSGNAGRANRHSYDFPNGSTVVVGGLDNPEKLFSTEWDTVLVGEASEIEEDDWEKLGRAMRNNRMPYQQRIAETNPDHPGHWLNKRAEQAPDELRLVDTREDYNRLQAFNSKPLGGKMRRLISKHHDNPAYWDIENWRWTPFGEQYVQGELANMSGHRRVRLFEGRWVAAEGVVYPEFNRARHVVAPFDIEAWPCYVGWDPGFDHVTAILWIAVAPNGHKYVVDEIYQGGRSVHEHCDEIRRRNGGRNVRRYYGDPQEFFSDRAQGKSCASQARECGFAFAEWPRTGTSEHAMVNQVRELLRKGELFVFETCLNTIMEFESWRYKRDAKGQLPAGRDQFEDRMNDAMDVVKGMVATNALKFIGPEHRGIEVVSNG